MSGSPLYAGLELGGTKCIAILAAGPDDIREQVELPTLAPAETLDALAAILRGWETARALGIASFGPLDLDPASPTYGSMPNTPKPGWTGASLLPLTRVLDVPFAIDTDVNGAALAEGRWGGAQGLTSWSYITVGTGIGVGPIVSGAPVRGLGHAEAGHMHVGSSDSWPGACPFHGDCAEGLASGPAIEARTGKAGGSLSDGDPVWNLVAEALARLCHNLVLTTCPERILIGGGIPTKRPQLIGLIRSALIASLAGYATGPQIATMIDSFVQPPRLGARAGPLGAIALAQTAI
ncbi:ROK family protein [Sphingomonas tabacisoli]|uniref:fructokinase n=1 Tax=Sphingomonas tabacisoli TaxID=2249466 RepID=A0ABW4HY91_9SPHN